MEKYFEIVYRKTNNEKFGRRIEKWKRNVKKKSRMDQSQAENTIENVPGIQSTFCGKTLGSEC